jgi:hypothetical protein
MSTESKWAARVADWRKSGLTTTEFCEGKGFSAGGQRYWSSRLRSGKAGKGFAWRASFRARTRLLPTRRSSSRPGNVRIGVRRGFDPEVLRAVLLVLSADCP